MFHASAHTLQAEYEQWKSRELTSRYEYAFADGTYFTVISNSEGCKMPILAVVGIGSNGEREVLGFQVGERENQQAWEDLFEDLKRRGVKEIGLLVSDGNQSTMNAIKLKFPQACRQRCVMHKMENVLSYVPTKQRDQVRPELRAIFYQKDRVSAELTAAAFVEKYQTIYPTAVACLQRDLDACYTFYDFRHPSTGRRFGPITSSRGCSRRSNVVLIRWLPLSAMRRAAYCSSTRSSAV